MHPRHTLAFALALAAAGLLAQTQRGPTMFGAPFDREGYGTDVAIADDGVRYVGGSPFWGNPAQGSNVGLALLRQVFAGGAGQVGPQISGSSGDELGGMSVDLTYVGTVPRVAMGFPGANAGAGVARVYDYNVGANRWDQVGGDMTALNTFFEGFGQSIVMDQSGTRVAVGAPFGSAPNSARDGYVRVYDLLGGVWTPVGGTIFGPNAQDAAGLEIDMTPDGGTLVVGIADHDGPNGTNAGLVRVYEVSGGTWTQVGGDIDGAGAQYRAGESVAISAGGTRVAVGVPRSGAAANGAGEVRVYDLVGSTWTQVGQTLFGDANSDAAGKAVDLDDSGERLAVGISGVDQPITNAGLARVYDLTAGQWQQSGTDIAAPQFVRGLGTTLELAPDGRALVVGAPDSDSPASGGTGAALMFDLPAPGVLPVELTAFAAVAKTRHNALSWTTATERDASHFEVERSGGGASWAMIGAVAAAGTTDAATDYGFVDESPLPSANYYRLRQVDLDGTAAYSPVAVVAGGAAGAWLADAAVYPNPARDFLAVAGLQEVDAPEGPGAVAARLLDVSGREVAALGFGESEGSRQQSRIRLSGVPAGVYALVIETATARVTRRVIVE